MKNLKIGKALFALISMLVMLSSFFTLPAFAATGDNVATPFAYQSFYSQAFIGSFNSGVYYMDGNYMAFEITCVSNDGQDHPVYVDLYRDIYGNSTVFTVHSDGLKRKYDGIPIGGGSAVDFVLSCNSNAMISFNLVFYSWN